MHAIRHGCTRPWRLILAGLAIMALLLPVAHSGAAAAATAEPGLRLVTYLGYSFKVPASWRVVDLDQHQRACVRFDRHAVYLGTPSPSQACPSRLLGTTEAMLVEPAAGPAAHISEWNAVRRQVNVVAHGIHITATFDGHRSQIDRILASAGLPRPVEDPPAVQQTPWLPAKVTNYQGRGFDTCTAPSRSVMQTWWNDSPYAAIGIYIGGSDAACAQPNLTPAWLRNTAAQGWHFIPLYVGPQAAFGELSTTSSAGQGTAAATDAANQAQRLGFAPKSPIYYDMEGYPPGQSTRVLRFLSAWSKRLHALGYSSGVYSSSSSGVADLARQYGRGVYTMPDVIYDALWNGQANTFDSVLSAGQWGNHHRLHQYRGNVTRTFGGVTLNIDLDFMNVRLPAVQHAYQTVVAALRVRTAPRTSAATVAVLGAAGTGVAVDCYIVGTAVFGDSVWYHIVAPYTGYVAGFYLNTGRDPAAGVPRC
jgi:glycoside hydrolase-like protein